MQTTAPDSRLYVVVGVLKNDKGKFLLQQRIAGKPCAGQWEFPGGKVEESELAMDALARELKEELSIEIREVVPLTQISQDYSHARVWLDVYLVNTFSGSVAAMEGQKFEWLAADEILQKDILPPVVPIIRVLEGHQKD